jgi:hypothetical protein
MEKSILQRVALQRDDATGSAQQASSRARYYRPHAVGRGVGAATGSHAAGAREDRRSGEEVARWLYIYAR